MENEQILTVVVIIAVVAVIGRIIINRQQNGGVNWRKLTAIAAAGVIFVGTMLSVDAYRIITWANGSFDANEGTGDGSPKVGRQAGESVPSFNSVEQGLPMYFTLTADSLSATGYWQIKEGAADDATVREVMVSQSDSTKTAIKRTTSSFSITRHPANEGDYVRIYRMSLPSGEKVLAVMTDYDAQPGQTPVMTAHPLTGKMADIAEKDGTVSQMVYATSFDSAFYASSSALRLLCSAIVALIVTLAAFGIVYGVMRIIKR